MRFGSDATTESCICMIRSVAPIGASPVHSNPALLASPMTSPNLFNRIWDLHTVATLPSGQTQLFIGQHLIHEVTSPQAFQILRDRGLKVLFPSRTLATVDHIIPTDNRARPFSDNLAEEMMSAIEKNCHEFGIELLNLQDRRQGIVHVVGPELGITQPGITLACGDSHTSTQGAYGALAFGIGSSEVAAVLATQTLLMKKPRALRVELTGSHKPLGVTAKDIALAVLAEIGVGGAQGGVIEFCGDAIPLLSMDERMTLCNQSVEAGARTGLIAPDAITFADLQQRTGREHLTDMFLDLMPAESSMAARLTSLQGSGEP